jgi:glutathione S-transferase
MVPAGLPLHPYRLALEELGLDYEVKFSDRTSASKAPEDFKLGSGNPLGKFPTIKDGDLVVYESGAISE